ncbi:MAG: ECF transporter S component [Oscillospiraceae bacterium]|nr:ECF transporter S component [Oscillospiraceae bacterium]
MKELLLTAKENGLFLLTCLGIFLAIVLVAWLAEHFLTKSKKNISSARRVSFIAMFGAIAAALMYIEIALPFAPPFYQIDFSEIPVLICTFYLGPVSGVICEFVKVLLKLLLKGTSTAFVGDFANFVVGCALVLPASIIYHCRKTRATAIWGMVAGTLIMTVFGSAFNAIYLLPKFAQLYGMPLEAIIGMGTDVNAHITSVSTLVLYAVVPFNLLKGVLVSVVTLLLYKRVERLLRMK